ncbi:unnamed protein product [Rotaria sordida]|uniref:Phosphosulfolactate synthase n=1 Tax=Rotaria sordida TaxID=392033 RepID=A0A814LWT5_9BILA|nr:unnamed protein product [Rotaria sordida]CAF1257504.1 unnamed protein product [Rotaria sordida]
MTNTFLSTSKLPEIADIFASYDRTDQKLTQEGKEGEVSIGCTFIIKNINGHRRALDISGISEYPYEEEYIEMFTSRYCVQYSIPLLFSIRSLSHHLPEHSTAFSFLPTNKLPSKPDRKKGITEIRGPYYAPVTRTYLNELLQDWGEYVDGIKFAGGSFSLMPEKRLREMIDIAHKHQCYVSTGGYIERVLSSSAGDKQIIKQYLKTCKDLGFDVLEISSGFLSIPADDWTELVKLVNSYGLKAKTEVGIQWGAGGDASIKELENAGTRDSKWLIDRAKKFLDAGAHMIMIESEGITENVKSWRTDIISAITSNLPQDKIMFEAADPQVFAYHIQNNGAHANLFIDHSQIVQLACLRKGIWGTNKTFGRIVTFQN